MSSWPSTRPPCAWSSGSPDLVRVEMEVGSLVAVLLLAECYQRAGRGQEAIGLMQELVEADPTPALVLSLCDLYREAGEWDEVVALGAGVQNTDDVTLQVRLMQAEALVEQGMPDAALVAFRECLRSKKRDPELLKAARYGRGRLLVKLGKRSQGLKDLAQIYAEDQTYLDVAELAKGEA